MNQPARRKSSLSGSNPVAPPPGGGVVNPAGIRPAELAQPVQPSSMTSPRADHRSTEQRKYPPKVSFYQDPEDTARLRAAYRHTLAATSDRSLSDFITRVVMAEVERLENQHNGGQPFPTVGTGEIPRGRPVGE